MTDIKRNVINSFPFSGIWVTTMKDGVHCDYYGKTIEELRKDRNCPNLIVVTDERMDFFMRRYAKSLQLPFTEISEERFDHYMNCVPPRRQQQNRFFSGECFTDNLYTFCFMLNGKYYEGLRPINTPNNELTQQIIDFNKCISFKAKLIKGDKFYDDKSHLHIKGFNTPYVFEGRDSCHHLIHNLFSETGNLFSDKVYRHSMARRLLNLRRHNYKYITVLSVFESVFDLFKDIQQTGDTIEIQDTLFRISPDRDYVDFIGVIKSYSAIKQPFSFHYRIYDREIFQHVINLLRTVKRGPSTVEYHRNPTPLELKQGYGAIHYLTVETEKVRKKDGSLKRWFIHTDGLRYYYNP